MTVKLGYGFEIERRLNLFGSRGFHRLKNGEHMLIMPQPFSSRLSPLWLID